MVSLASPPPTVPSEPPHRGIEVRGRYMTSALVQPAVRVIARPVATGLDQTDRNALQGRVAIKGVKRVMAPRA